jgi:hypothetical protein
MGLCQLGRLQRVVVSIVQREMEGKPTGENAIKLEFAIDVLLLDLDICRSVDLRRHDDKGREAWVSLKGEESICRV